MEIRSFLAFELPREIKRIVSDVSLEMKRFPLDVRWTKVENIHLTIVFLGNIHTDQLGPMGEAVKRVCQSYEPFNISLNGAGAFGNRRNPRVLWVGLKGDLERMSPFRDVLQEHLGPFGIKEEKRRFKPHLTLGRFRKGGARGASLNDLLSPYQDLTSPVCAIEELALFKSDLKPGGPIYTKLNTWPLNGTR
jgi:2'-5' RNA ligase